VKDLYSARRIDILNSKEHIHAFIMSFISVERSCKTSIITVNYFLSSSVHKVVSVDHTQTSCLRTHLYQTVKMVLVLFFNTEEDTSTPAAFIPGLTYSIISSTLYAMSSRNKVFRISS